MIDTVKIKTARHHRNDAKDRVLQSPIPDAVAKTLGLLISKIGPNAHYELAWPSKKTLAEELHKGEETIDRHITAILKSGIITAEKLDSVTANRMLAEQYGYKPKKPLWYPHELHFYRIDYADAFWGDIESDATTERIREVVTTIKSVLAKRNTKRTRKGEDDYMKATRKPLAGDRSEQPGEPLAGEETEPLAGEAENPSPAPDEHGNEETAEASVSSKPVEDRNPEPEQPGGAIFDRQEADPITVEAKAEHSVSNQEAPTLTLDGRYHLSDCITNPLVQNLVADVEARLRYPLRGGNNFTFSTKVNPLVVAARLQKLLLSLPTLPTPEAMVTAINSTEFRGLKELGWGLLVSDAYRDRFKKELKERMAPPPVAAPAPRPWRGLLELTDEEEAALATRSGDMGEFWKTMN